MVSHIGEKWATPIDSKLSDIADIIRIDVDDEINKAINEDLDELDKEISETEADIKKAAEDTKEKFSKKLEELKAKRTAKVDELKAKIDVQKHSFDRWTQKVKDKLS